MLAVLAGVFIIALAARLLPLGPADQWTLSYRGSLSTLWSPVSVAIGFGLGVALGFIPMLRRYAGVAVTIATICIVCAGLNLSFHRPLRGQLWLPRATVSGSHPGGRDRQISAGGSGASNPRGATPMTVCWMPFKSRDFPKTDGSLPNARCHNP